MSNSPNSENLQINSKTNSLPLNDTLDLSTIKIEDFLLYLNVIGGHSFFISYNSKYLIKSTSINEIKFYEFTKRKNLHSNCLPKYYGIIEENSPQYQFILTYLKQCEIFFREMVKFFDIKLSDIFIEKDYTFEKKYNDFISSKSEDIKLLSSFNKLKKDLIKISNNSKNQLYWIFFWFIKWKSEFITNKYIIIENYEYGINTPFILDLKLGMEQKISKETGAVKLFLGVSKELGLRIMGILCKNIYFKSRYETKHMSKDEFKNEMNYFFENKKNMIENVIKKISDIIEFVNKFPLKIYFCSLLILYDESNEGSGIKIGLVDFDLVNNDKKNSNIFEVENIKIENDLNNNLKKCINNFTKVLSE